MNLKTLSNDQLIRETQRVIKIESSATVAVIRRFREIYERELFLAEGYSSLFQMATELFGYENASAQRRINAMELMISSPIVEAKLESNELSLQAAADVQTFLNLEAKLKRPYSPLQITELVEVCSKKSVAAVRRELAARNPVLKFRETKRAIGRDRIEIKYSITSELDAKLERLKQIWSHSNPSMSHEELIEKMTELALKAVDPLRKAERADRRAAKLKSNSSAHAVSASQQAAAPSWSFKEVRVSEAGELQLEVDFETVGDAIPVSFPSAETTRRTRYIPAESVRRTLASYDGQGCTFISVSSGKRCGSKYLSELDHIHEWSRGGSNESTNLRILCSAHNRWRSQRRKPNLVRSRTTPYAA